MLNRRLLRGRVLQALYAYKQCKEASFLSGQDIVAAEFEPDLNSPEAPNYTLLNELKENAKHLYEQNYQERHFKADGALNASVALAASKGIQYYQDQVRKYRKQCENDMLRETDKLEQRHFSLIALLIKFGELAALDERDKKMRSYTIKPMFEYQFKLKNNAILQHFKKHASFQENASKMLIGWDEELVREWYKLLKEDTAYMEYAELLTADFEHDKIIIDHIVRHFIFKNDLVLSYFEELHINWKEDKPVLKDLLLKSIKAVVPETLHSETELAPLGINWEEDREFFLDLYRHTIVAEDDFESIIGQNLKNWEWGRVALTDRIILEMAVAEMINFSSIPVKVSINEYIELSKLFSSKKSKDFINGLLDTTAEELQKSGVILKSGRGLIDNK
ncbi:MAG: transcription antitermination factor NusB [Cytophagales bacterium]|nr:MAG: transcription antitermination factor NusB [Cytophagales bacterium]TAF60007.1 MAG: transcription antitermination factor NusB [Cytophagales bacterium]